MYNMITRSCMMWQPYWKESTLSIWRKSISSILAFFVKGRTLPYTPFRKSTVHSLIMSSHIMGIRFLLLTCSRTGIMCSRNIMLLLFVSAKHVLQVFRFHTCIKPTYWKPRKFLFILKRLRAPIYEELSAINISFLLRSVCSQVSHKPLCLWVIFWYARLVYTRFVLLRISNPSVIENDHLGDWSPEKDYCWRLKFRQFTEQSFSGLDHPDDHFQSRYVPPGFKPFSYFV